MEEYRNEFKYRAIQGILKRVLDIKTVEALIWRRKARRYLKNFPYQWNYRHLSSWTIDNELFEELQFEAQTLMVNFEGGKNQ